MKTVGLLDFCTRNRYKYTPEYKNTFENFKPPVNTDYYKDYNKALTYNYLDKGDFNKELKMKQLGE